MLDELQDVRNREGSVKENEKAGGSKLTRASRRTTNQNGKRKDDYNDAYFTEPRIFLTIF